MIPAKGAVDGVNLAKAYRKVADQGKFLNRFILRMYITNAASTKGFGRGAVDSPKAPRPVDCSVNTKSWG